MNVINADSHTWGALIYGEKPPSLINYFQEQVNNVPSNLLDIGKTFYSNVKDIYNKYNSSDVLFSIRNVLRNVNNVFQPESIKPLFDTGSLQTANITMQRWIMANPIIKQNYLDQRLDGYIETYVDVHGGVGKNNYDYRRATNGLVIDDTHVEYFEDLIKDDRELTHVEQDDILTTWELAEIMIKKQENDPTSSSGGML